MEFRTNEEKCELKKRIHICEKTEDGEELSYTGYVWGKLYRATFLRQYKFKFDETLKGCQDLLFNYKAFDMARGVIGSTYLGYHYRFVVNGITRQYSPNRPFMWHDYLEKLCAYINAHNEITPQDIEIIHFVALRSISESLNKYYFHPQNQESYLECAKEIRQMKQMPIYREALLAQTNHYMTSKMKVLKAALRLPVIWPVRFLYVLKAASGRLTNKFS